MKLLSIIMNTIKSSEKYQKPIADITSTQKQNIKYKKLIIKSYKDDKGTDGRRTIVKPIYRFNSPTTKGGIELTKLIEKRRLCKQTFSSVDLSNGGVSRNKYYPERANIVKSSLLTFDYKISTPIRQRNIELFGFLGRALVDQQRPTVKFSNLLLQKQLYT
jgi:hypothetical protein